MTLAFRPDETSPLADALLADLGVAPERAIAAGDEMLGFLAAAQAGDRERALCEYFRSGASIADSLGQVLRWRFGDFGQTWDEDCYWSAGRNYLINLLGLDFRSASWTWNYEPVAHVGYAHFLFDIRSDSAGAATCRARQRPPS